MSAHVAQGSLVKAVVHGRNRLFKLLLLFSILLLPGLAGMAHANAVDTGKAWLAAQVAPAGSVNGEAASVGLATQVRSEASRTLAVLGASVPNALLLKTLENPLPTTEYLARYKLAAAQRGQSVSAFFTQLETLQNADGGFGAAIGFASSPLDTAWALTALTPERTTSQPAQRAVGWLLAAQRADGSWYVGADEDGVVPTALAVQALQEYRNYTGVNAALSKARGWLMGQRSAANFWRDEHSTAQAVLAVAPGLTSSTTLAPTIAALEQAQRADGSWSSDPHVTAVVLRALWRTQQPNANPDLASVRGVVVNQSGQPIAGATVELVRSGLQVVTDANGAFSFSQLAPGSEQLRIQASGYLSLTSELALVSGQVLDLTNIMLRPATAANASTVTISGVARYSDDGAQWHPASGASIKVGTLSVTADVQGRYSLINVPPGAIEVVATYAGYRAVTGRTSAQAGENLLFDPQFVRGTNDNTLRVMVTNQASGNALDTATVDLNDIVQTVDSNGQAYFATGVVTGSNTVTVSASGFETRIVGFDVQGRQNITLPISLAPAVVSATQTVLAGIVTDADTALPLSGASVRITGTSYQATTNAAGEYTITGAADLAGQHEIMIDRAGYQSHAQVVSFTLGSRHQFDVPLQGIVDPDQPTRLQVLVTDQLTHQPVANATVTLSGNNPYVLTTDAAGMAEISGLNAGSTQLDVAASGYDSVALYVDLQAGQSYRVPVELTPKQIGSDRVYGTVFDAQTRRPIAGARVILAGTDMLETTTDANGRYEFTTVTLGYWNLTGMAGGYKGSSRPFDIRSSTQIDIPMQPDLGNRFDQSALRTVVAGHPNNGGATGYLFVFGAPGVTGTVVSNDLYINHDFVIGRDGVAEIMIPERQFISVPNVVAEKALLVYANEPVSAYFLNRLIHTTDMSYLLDVSALGVEYRVLGWHAGFPVTQLSMTAVEDNTNLIIEFSTTLPTGQFAGESYPFELNKGQSIYFAAPNGRDFTGTKVVANKPLAVFSGAQCTNVPVAVSACDHIFSYIPPVDHWDTEYVIAETAGAGRAGNLVRILAHYDQTEVVVNGVPVATLNAGEFHQLDSANDLHIVSSKPVLVGQFLKGFSATGKGDPAFSVVPGIGQTLRDYVYTAPVNFAAYRENYLNVAVPDTALTSLRLNGVPVDTSAFRPIGTTGYSAGNVAIGTGPGRIQASQPFFATISGFSTYDSYHTIIGANYSLGASLGDPLVAAIDVATDRLAYPPNTAVDLQATVRNQGRAAGILQIVLQINDSGGAPVIRFAPVDLGSVASGATVSHSEPWNSASYPAGTYTLIGTLLDDKGTVVGTASTLFVITASGAQAPAAALAVTTDRALYRPDDRVRIDNLVRNLTPNAHIDDARVAISVAAPDGTVVFTTTHSLGQLLAGGLRALDAQQVLRAAAPGTYVVTATLIGSGNLGSDRSYSRDVELARASTRYQVATDGGGGPVPGPVNNPGEDVDYAVVKTVLRDNVAVGDDIVWQIVVSNAGPHDGEAGGVLIEDVLPAGLVDARWTCVASGQAACGAASGTGNIQTDAIIYAGDDDRVTFTLQARAQAAGSFDNTAVLTPLGAVQDSNPANDRSTARVTASGKGTVPTGQTADYAIVKTAVAPVVMAPGSVRYRLVVTNRGPDAGGGVAISDLLPAQLANARWSCVASGNARCAVDAANVRGEGHVSLPTARVAQGRNALTIDIVADVASAGVVSNTATVTAAPGTRDPDASNDRSTADVEVRSGGGPLPPQPPPGTIQPIPVNRPAALLLLIALVALLGSRQARTAWGGRP